MNTPYGNQNPVPEQEQKQKQKQKQAKEQPQSHQSQSKSQSQIQIQNQSQNQKDQKDQNNQNISENQNRNQTQSQAQSQAQSQSETQTQNQGQNQGQNQSLRLRAHSKEIAIMEWDHVGEKVNKLDHGTLQRLQELLAELKTSQYKCLVLLSRKKKHFYCRSRYSRNTQLARQRGMFSFSSKGSGNFIFPRKTSYTHCSSHSWGLSWGRLRIGFIL